MVSYKESTRRNYNLISRQEQNKLRDTCVAIAGLGGSGGGTLVALARLGIGKFVLADGDRFDESNINRQYGAFVSTIGQPKVEVMAKILYDINPEIEIRCFDEPITKDNVEDFLTGVNILVDGIDAFEIASHRLIINHAQDNKIWTISAGPIGFGVVWNIWQPEGMRWDEFFGTHENINPTLHLIKCASKLLKGGPQSDYTSIPSLIWFAPGLSLACELVAGVVCTEVVRILFHEKDVQPIPVVYKIDILTRTIGGKICQ